MPFGRLEIPFSDDDAAFLALFVKILNKNSYLMINNSSPGIKHPTLIHYASRYSFFSEVPRDYRAIEQCVRAGIFYEGLLAIENANYSLDA